MSNKLQAKLSITEGLRKTLEGLQATEKDGFVNDMLIELLNGVSQLEANYSDAFIWEEELRLPDPQEQEQEVADAQ